MTAISESVYKKNTAETWKGLKVRNLVQLKNGYFVAPVGTVFKITGKQKGFDLELSEPCACCGLKGHIGKVPPQWLEVVQTELGA